MKQGEGMTHEYGLYEYALFEYGLEDIGPDHSADVPDPSKNGGEGCEYIVGLSPLNSESEEEADSTPSETCPEKQPVLEEQLLLTKDMVWSNANRAQGRAKNELIKCRQGTRKGKKCTDILWVGNEDEEGKFILRRKIKDYFFKYIGEGFQTIMVRTTVEVPTNMVAEWVCEFFDKKVGKSEPWNTFIGKELHLTFKGEAETGQDLMSTYPEQTLFLLSKGPLADEFLNHQGKLWECTDNCENADSNRSHIFKDRKCSHKILFKKDQPTKTWGNLCEKPGKPIYIPKLSCGPASPSDLSAPPTPAPHVSTSLDQA